METPPSSSSPPPATPDAAVSADAATPVPAPHADAIAAILAAHVASECAVADLLEFPATLPCFEALKELRKRNVTGALVYHTAPAHDSEWLSNMYPVAMHTSSRVYVGFVDVADVAALALASGFKARGKGLLGKLAALLASDEAHQVSAAVNLSGRNAMASVSETDTFGKAAVALARGIRRLAVLDASRTVVTGIITQSHIIRVLRAQCATFPALASLPVSALFPLGLTRVTTLPVTATVREALETLLERQVTSVPLVNEEGGVETVFSVSDLRGLSELGSGDAEAAMGRPALWLVSPHDGSKITAPPRAPIVVMSSDCIATVLAVVDTAAVHRVFVVDALCRPVGVVSLTDLLKLVTSPTMLLRHSTSAISRADSEVRLPVPIAPSLSHSALVDLLADTTAHAFLHRDGVHCDKMIDVGVTVSLRDVLAIMREHKLSVLPVYRDEVTSHTPVVLGPASVIAIAQPTRKHYVGWVDAADVVSYVLAKLGGAREEGLTESLFALFGTPTHKSMDLVNHSDANPFWAIPHDRTLDQVLRVLSRNVHRLAVIGGADSVNPRIQGIITQSALVRFLSTHRHLFGALGERPLGSLAADGPLVTCPADASLHDALALLADRRVSGLPIVDADGRLVANLSATDIRYLDFVSLPAVLKTVSGNVVEFLGASRSGRPVAPLCVRRTDSFSTAVMVLVSASLHRVYIVDDDCRPVGVFTLTDALRAFAPLTVPSAE